jgi:hypothetical protein
MISYFALRAPPRPSRIARVLPAPPLRDFVPRPRQPPWTPPSARTRPLGRSPASFSRRRRCPAFPSHGVLPNLRLPEVASSSSTSRYNNHRKKRSLSLPSYLHRPKFVHRLPFSCLTLPFLFASVAKMGPCS